MLNSNKLILLSKALIAWSILIFVLGITQSHAFSPGIKLHITKASLKSKCRSAGGVFDEQGKGYKCTLSKSNGRLIVVNCDGFRECVGQNGTGETRSFKTSRTGAIAIR